MKVAAWAVATKERSVKSRSRIFRILSIDGLRAIEINTQATENTENTEDEEKTVIFADAFSEVPEVQWFVGATC